jgi:TRAP-type mannitol/chloroaromatic compound transport system permease large subunit
VSWVSILALMFTAKVGILLTALPVAFVFFCINIVGSYFIFGGSAGLEQMVRNEQLSVAQFSLVPIPLFVLMGEVLFHTGLAMRSIDAVDAVIRRVPGRLAVVALVAGTVFSAHCCCHR